MQGVAKCQKIIRHRIHSFAVLCGGMHFFLAKPFHQPKRHRLFMISGTEEIRIRSYHVFLFLTRD